MIEIAKLTSDTFTRFVKSQGILGSSRVVIDLNRINFISPGGIVPLASLCEYLSSGGREIVIKAHSKDLQDVLIRSGFFHVVEKFAVFDPVISPVRVGELENWRGANPSMVEITRLSSAEGLSERLDKVLKMLRFRMEYKPSQAFDATIAVSEICQNAFDHNKGTCGFFALQRFGEFTKFVEICVSDHGVGLMRSLKNNSLNPIFGNDVEAIKYALKSRVSEFNDQTRGTGLGHLLTIAKKYKGSIQIISGTGSVKYRADKEEWYPFTSVDIPGVSVILSLPG